MHSIRRTGTAPNAKWVVQFVESGSDPGYRPTRDNIAWFDGFFDACAFSSWLNGGPTPSEAVINAADYIE